MRRSGAGMHCARGLKLRWVQLYKNNACMLISHILGIVTSDWLHQARSVHRVPNKLIEWIANSQQGSKITLLHLLYSKLQGRNYSWSLQTQALHFVAIIPVHLFKDKPCILQQSYLSIPACLYHIHINVNITRQHPITMCLHHGWDILMVYQSYLSIPACLYHIHINVNITRQHPITMCLHHDWDILMVYQSYLSIPACLHHIHINVNITRQHLITKCLHHCWYFFMLGLWCVE